MPSALPKSLSLCFSIIKRPSLSSSSTSAATSDNLHRPSSSTTSSSSSSQPPHYLKTYNSLYETKSSSDSSADEDMVDAVGESTPDLATAYASHRFFFASPGRSNSIIDSESDSANLAPAGGGGGGGGVAVQTDSPDPYGDFRRSMEEMVEARGLHDVGENWSSLHELLLCYLSLNPKPTHPFIVAAFSDLLVSLMPLPEDGAALPPACLGVCRCSSQ